MKINIKRINEKVNLEAVNEDGVKILMDGTPAIGGENLGMRPMQVLLASLGGCSSMDVLSILNKMQQNITNFEVSIDGDREPNVEPSVFKTIHVHFKVQGPDLDATKVEKAIHLSMTKYCSVVKTLEPTATITFDFEI